MKRSPAFFLLSLSTSALAQEERPVVAIAPRGAVPSPNGFDLYLAAKRAVVHPKPFIDPNSDGDVLQISPAEKRQRYSLERRLKWERESAKGWALFEQAKRARSLHPLKRSLHARWPDYAGLRQLARDKIALANTRLLQGRANEALENDLDIVQMGHDIQRGGSLFPMLVGEAISAIGVGAVWHTNPSGNFDAKHFGITEDVTERLNATEARLGARRLEELLKTRPRFSAILREDIAVTQVQWLQLWDKPALQAGQTKSVFSFPAPRESQSEKFALYNRAAQAFLQRADRPVGAVGSWPDLQLNVQAISSYSPRRYALDYACAQAREQQLMLRLALRSFKLEHGHAPTKLVELVPRYLKQVPVDPFGAGEAWRFQNGAAWSIGPDGKNNGGQPIYRDDHHFVRPDYVNLGALGDVVARG